MIEIMNLTKKFKNRTAVNAVSLAIESGELFALLGQNGAGKSTTIRMLTCLTKPTDGDALIMSKSIKDHPNEVKQIINVSPQETAVAQKISVRENLEMMAKLYGYGPLASKKKANQLMAQFGLEQRAHEKAKTLSGGLKRKLSIAMALISEPQIVFLDEPTIGLDVRARRELWEHIKTLKGQMTIVLTTHYLEEAVALADRIGILDHGQLKIVGTADDIVNHAQTRTFEEAFLKHTEEVQS